MDHHQSNRLGVYGGQMQYQLTVMMAVVKTERWRGAPKVVAREVETVPAMVIVVVLLLVV